VDATVEAVGAARAGIFLVLLGLFGYALAMPGVTIGGVNFDAHTLLFSSLSILLGYESIVFAI